MKKILKITNLLMIIFAISAVSLSAQEMAIDAGSIYIAGEKENGSMSVDTIFNEDYFAGGNDIYFSGEADDLYIFARSLEYSGQSTGALTAVAESVEISGLVGKNLHSGANSVTITGHLMETAFIGAQNILISKEAVLDGTLVSGSSSLHIIGKLNKGLLAGAGEIIIDGPVLGDVHVKTGKLIITERGSIDGDLTYGSNVEISAKEESRVKGLVTYEIDDKIEKKDFSTFIIVACVLFFLAIVVGGLLILLLPGVKSLFTRERENASYGKTLLWGLIPLFIFPVAILVSIPLFPLSISLALAAFPLMGLTTVLGLALAGQFFFKIFKWEKDSIHLQFLTAFGIYAVLTMIPFVKVLFILSAAALGAGLLIGKLFNTDF